MGNLIDYHKKGWLVQDSSFWNDQYDTLFSELLKRILSGEITFFPVNDLNKPFDYGIDALIFELSTLTNNQYVGYSSKKIEADGFGRVSSFDGIIHFELLRKLKYIYDNQFSYNFYYAYLTPFIDHFRVNTVQPSNYFPYIYNTNGCDSVRPRLYWYKYPLFILSKAIVNRFFYFAKKNYNPILSERVTPDHFKLTNSSISHIQSQLTQYVNTHLNGGLTNLDLNWLKTDFNSYMDVVTGSEYGITIQNMIFVNYYQHFSYLLATKYASFHPLSSLYSKYKKEIQKRTQSCSVQYRKDLTSLFLIPFHFVNNPIRFINSHILSFSEWSQACIDQNLFDSTYEYIFSHSDLNQIIQSIYFTDTAHQSIIDNYVEDLISSNVIELTIKQCLTDLVSLFLKNHAIREKLYFQIRPNYSDYLSNDVRNNMANFENGLAIILLNELIQTSELINLYKDVIASTSFLLTIDYNAILTSFYRFKTADLDNFRDDLMKFDESLIRSDILKRYLNKYRL